MDFWIIAAVTMLLGWAWITFTTTAPGWVHLLLTAGMFLLIWRIVVRGTPLQPQAPSDGSKPPRR
jgi:hypothetical protein